MESLSKSLQGLVPDVDQLTWIDFWIDPDKSTQQQSKPSSSSVVPVHAIFMLTQKNLEISLTL